jgi:hypothetical protein
MFWGNVGNHLQDHMASQRRRPVLKYSLQLLKLIMWDTGMLPARVVAFHQHSKNSGLPGTLPSPTERTETTDKMWGV